MKMTGGVKDFKATKETKKKMVLMMILLLLIKKMVIIIPSVQTIWKKDCWVRSS